MAQNSFLGSSFILLLVLTVFTIFGGFIFNYIEAPYETKVASDFKIQSEKFRSNVENLWKERATKYFDAHLKQNENSVDKFVKEVINSGMTQFDELLSAYEKELETAISSGYSPSAADDNNADDNDDEQATSQWNLWTSMYYCFTVYTTIGYGNVFPRTLLGQVVSVVYGILGIPLCLVVLTRLGQIFNRGVKAVWNRCVRSNAGFWALYQNADDQFDYPLPIAFVLVAGYILLGSVLYSFWEDWSLTKSAYFTFVSLSTIGFGDVLPNDHRFFLITSLYLGFGLALVGLFINQLVDRIECFLQPRKERVD